MTIKGTRPLSDLTDGDITIEKALVFALARAIVSNWRDPREFRTVFCSYCGAGHHKTVDFVHKASCPVLTANEVIELLEGGEG